MAKSNPQSKADALIFKRKKRKKNQIMNPERMIVCVLVIIADKLAEFPHCQIFCSV